MMSLPQPEEFLTINNMLWFAGGGITMRIWCEWQARRLDRTDPDGAPHNVHWRTIFVAWTLVLLAIGYIAVQTQVAHNLTLQQACVLYHNDQLAKKERDALINWVTVGMVPPPSIFSLHTTDPAYQEWAKGVNQHFLDEMNGIEQQRATIDASQLKHPLLGPTCELG
jgi:hypothetical protein